MSQFWGAIARIANPVQLINLQHFDLIGTLSTYTHLSSLQARHSETKFLFLIANSWGAATKQSPLKINELNDG